MWLSLCITWSLISIKREWDTFIMWCTSYRNKQYQWHFIDIFYLYEIEQISTKLSQLKNKSVFRVSWVRILHRFYLFSLYSSFMHVILRKCYKLKNLKNCNCKNVLKVLYHYIYIYILQGVPCHLNNLYLKCFHDFWLVRDHDWSTICNQKTFVSGWKRAIAS